MGWGADGWAIRPVFAVFSGSAACDGEPRRSGPGNEPSLDLQRAKVQICDGGEVDPVERDLGFSAMDFGGGLGAGVFHVEHQVQFMSRRAALVEQVLGCQKQFGRHDDQAGFLEELAGDGGGGGFAGLDVAAGEVEVAVLLVAAEEDGVT